MKADRIVVDVRKKKVNIITNDTTVKPITAPVKNEEHMGTLLRKLITALKNKGLITNADLSTTQ